METSKVYVIVGCCGRYADRSEWNVGAYLEKNQADACADYMNNLYKEKPDNWRHLLDIMDENWSDLDNNLHYCVDEVPLKVYGFEKS